MVICVTVLLGQTANFGRELIFDPKVNTNRQEVRATVLTEDEVIGGYYCANRSNQSDETRNSKPFVWDNGTLHWLQLGKAQYGRVFAGNTKALVGEIQTVKGTFPAKWTPDPKGRWSKAKLTQIGTDSGRAVAVSRNGDIWVKHPLDFLIYPSHGQRSRVRLERFEVIGCDGWNRAWGNAGTRDGFSARLIEDYKMSEVSPGRVLGGINSRADWCGITEKPIVPIVSYKGKVSEIPLPRFLTADAADINDSGAVVGQFTQGSDMSDRAKGDPYRTFGYIFKGGRTMLLPDPIPNEPGFYPAVINNHGSIVGRTPGIRPRIYLLRPR